MFRGAALSACGGKSPNLASGVSYFLRLPFLPLCLAGFFSWALATASLAALGLIGEFAIRIIPYFHQHEAAMHST